METQSAIPVTSVAYNQMEPLHDTPDPDPNTNLPHWLQEPQLPTPDDPPVPRSQQTASNQLTTYGSLFETVLERVMGGTPIHTIVASDPRGIQLGRFLYWINRDPHRKARYEEACIIAAEAMAHELNVIADGLPPAGEAPALFMEDSQRSALRLKSRMYLMEKWSPQRYGDTRRVQIDQTTVTASMTAEDLRSMSLDDLKRLALERFARAHNADADVIDVTPLEDAA
jgi:hypothetical protein